MTKQIILAIAFLGNAMLFAQTGSLKGKVLDETNGEGVAFANIVLLQSGAQVKKTVASLDGEFDFNGLTPGYYDLKTAAMGCQSLITKGVVVDSNKTTYLDSSWCFRNSG